MFNTISFQSILLSATSMTNNFIESAKSLLSNEPEPLWLTAMQEPSYEAYRQFKIELQHAPDIALKHLVSPYAVMIHKTTNDEAKNRLKHALETNPTKAIRFFYDDVINYLIELSAGQIDIKQFKALITFYRPYVPKEIYQPALQQSNKLNKQNLQHQIHRIIKHLNSVIKGHPLFVNTDEEESDEAEVKEIESVGLDNDVEGTSWNYKPFIFTLGVMSLLGSGKNLNVGLMSERNHSI